MRCLPLFSTFKYLNKLHITNSIRYFSKLSDNSDFKSTLDELSSIYNIVQRVFDKDATKQKLEEISNELKNTEMFSKVFYSFIL